jgi:hypothetical protein
VRQLLRCDADEPGRHPARAHRARPRGFAAVIDERRQHDGHVTIDQVAGGGVHVVAGTRRQRRCVGQVHARHLVKSALQSRDHARHSRKWPQPRSVAADDRILANETVTPFDVREHDSHRLHPTATRQSSAARDGTAAGVSKTRPQ